MGKLNNSLKNLGNKLTGQEIASNKLTDIIEETAEKYEGGSGDEVKILRKVRENGNYPISEDELKNLKNGVYDFVELGYYNNDEYIKEYLFIRNYFLNSVNYKGYLYTTTIIPKGWFGSSTKWYGVEEYVGYVWWLNYKLMGDRLIVERFDITNYDIQQSQFDALYKSSVVNLILTDLTGLSRAITLYQEDYLSGQGKLFYTTNGNTYECFIANILIDGTETPLIRYFDNTGAIQTVNPSNLDENNFVIYAGRHYETND